MATTEIIPFAETGGANVIDQAAYVALAERLTGFVAGIATSAQLNKVWRQSSFMACGLAGWVVTRDISVPDDGDVPALVTKINNALIDFVTEFLTSIDAVTGVTVTTDGTLGANSDALIPTEKAVKTYVDSQVSPTWDFISSLHAVGGNFSFAHGLAGTPGLFLATAICISADQGYSVDDEIVFDSSPPGSAPSPNGGTWVNATTIGSLSDSTAIKLKNKSSGTEVDGDASKWNVRLKAKL